MYVTLIFKGASNKLRKATLGFYLLSVRMRKPLLPGGRASE